MLQASDVDLGHLVFAAKHRGQKEPGRPEQDRVQTRRIEAIGELVGQGDTFHGRGLATDAMGSRLREARIDRAES